MWSGSGAEWCGSGCARQSAAVEDEGEAAAAVRLEEAVDDMDAGAAFDLDEAIAGDRGDVLGGLIGGETLQGALELGLRPQLAGVVPTDRHVEHRRRVGADVLGRFVLA